MTATPDSPVAARRTLTLPRLYPIVDAGFCQGRGLDPVALAEACLRGGARILQVRAKSGGSAAFLELAERIVSAAGPFGATIIVNDRPDIARLVEAGGVHVGQEDLQVGDARRIVGPAAVIGLSTHTEAQIEAALASAADYLAVGPIFGTATKETGYAARGLDLLRFAAGRGTPVVAIGGITLASAPAALEAGAASVAVIADLVADGDPEARVREFLRALT